MLGIKKKWTNGLILFMIFFMLSSSLIIANAEEIYIDKDQNGSAGRETGRETGSKYREKAVAGNTVRDRVQAGVRTTFEFQHQTRITINSSNNINININCDVNSIGTKEFEIDIQVGDKDKELSMTMTCTGEQEELGLINGSTVQVRNRVQHRYQEGFVAQIECEGEFKAQLKIKANENNQGGTWAYYDNVTGEWVPVQTMEQEGYLVAETNHFSTWTVLIPTVNSQNIIIGSLVAAVAIVATIVIVIVIRRRK